MKEHPISATTDGTSEITRQNVEAIAKLEEEAIRNRSLADRAADAIAGFSGSLRFVILHIVVYGLWITVNLGIVPFIRPFDRFPFLLLSMVVSLEAIFLSTFVLIKQNRDSRRADQRAHLDLQINLLAEREMTLSLQLLQLIARKLEIRVPGREIAELSKFTSVEALVSELEQKLPGE